MDLERSDNPPHRSQGLTVQKLLAAISREVCFGIKLIRITFNSQFKPYSASTRGFEMEATAQWKNLAAQGIVMRLCHAPLRLAFLVRTCPFRIPGEFYLKQTVQQDPKLQYLCCQAPVSESLQKLA